MCEQTEVRYLDGDVVWVKLGYCWWPGRVKDVDQLPEEILASLKKKPIAAVKFFQEETLLVPLIVYFFNYLLLSFKSQK